MKQTMRRLMAAVLCLTILCAALPAAAGQSDFAVTANFLSAQAGEPQAGSTYGDWEIFALARTGISVPEGYYAAYLTKIERVLTENRGRLPGAVSGNLRLALALTALDQDLSDIGGNDLMALVKNTALVCRTTVMGPTFGLLVLRSNGGDDACETIYLQHLLDKQLADGGWALSGTLSDPDATAMALQALSYYQHRAGVSQAIQRGLARLSSLQQPNGGFFAWGTASSESIAQAIIALCLLDIPLSDTRFVKNGTDLLEALLTFRLADGSFCHVAGGGYDVMGTHQSMLALDALRRESAGLPGVYDLTDRVTVDRAFKGLPGRDPAIAVPAVTLPQVTFPDISGIPQEQAILALARRGILNGMGNGKFEPAGPLNRAQFCAMAVRALSLPAAGSYGFTDVPAGEWYTDVVNAAAAFGAVNGVGGGRFAPLQDISRQDAATLVSRLAKKCGITVHYGEAAARNVLAQFTDYRTCADYATEGLAFCYDRGLLDDSVMEIQPEQPISRAEAAQMFLALLDCALLLED